MSMATMVMIAGRKRDSRGRYMGGDDGTLHNVHRVDVGAIDLKLYAKSNAASGWSGTEVQVYNG